MTDMAKLQTNVAALTTAADNLTQEVIGKMRTIDARVATKEQEIDSFIASARNEIPNLRITKNQTLDGPADSIPNHWFAHSDMKFERVGTVRSGIEWSARTPLEQEILTALGYSGIEHFTRSFHVYRMTWEQLSSAGSGYTLYQQFSAPGLITVAAVTKLVSGEIDHFWTKGATNKWKITGVKFSLGRLDYSHCHPYRQSQTGEILFALPACVMGDIDLAHWGLFPYLPSTFIDDVA